MSGRYGAYGPKLAIGPLGPLQKFSKKSGFFEKSQISDGFLKTLKIVLGHIKHRDFLKFDVISIYN